MILSSYISSEEEFIRTSKYATKFSHVSRPRHKNGTLFNSYNLNNILENSSSFNNEAMANLNLTADQLNNLLKTLNVANSADKLATYFLGSRTRVHPMFEAKKRVSQLTSHYCIATLRQFQI